MGLRSWLEQAEEDPVVLAHVAGPPGVGKSTLMQAFKSAHPEVLVVDLDQLDDFGTRKLGLPWNWKSSQWERDKLHKSHHFRQAALDRFLRSAAERNRMVVLFGIHHELDTVYQFHAKHRFLLTRPAEEVVRDRVRRDAQWLQSQGETVDEKELEQTARHDHEQITQPHWPWQSRSVSFPVLAGVPSWLSAVARPPQPVPDQPNNQ